jgi:hypothetical protein
LQGPQSSLPMSFEFAARRQQVARAKQIYRVHHTLDYK